MNEKNQALVQWLIDKEIPFVSTGNRGEIKITAIYAWRHLRELATKHKVWYDGDSLMVDYDVD